MPLIVSVSIAGGMTVPKRRSSCVRKKLHFRGGFSLFLLHNISRLLLPLPLHGGGGPLVLLVLQILERIAFAIVPVEVRCPDRIVGIALLL
jgi:hypothetical protein